MDDGRRGEGRLRVLAFGVSAGLVTAVVLWLYVRAGGEPLGENEPPIAAELRSGRLRVVLGDCDAFDSATVTVTAGPDGQRLGDDATTIWSGPASAAHGIVEFHDVRLPTTHTEWIIVQATTSDGDAKGDYFLAVAPEELDLGADRSGPLSTGEFERLFNQCEGNP